MTVYLLNITPSSAVQNQISFQLLFKQQPSYDHLRVFGCLCFSSLNHSNLHKLAPHTTPCLFLGHPSQHRGYRCLDLKMKKIIISRNVYFDEETFPAAVTHQNRDTTYHLLEEPGPSSVFQNILQSSIQNQPLNPPIPTEHEPKTIPIQPTAPPQQPRHQIRTRSQTGSLKPKQITSLITTTKSPLPKSHIQALSDPNWTPAMTDEIDAMIKTKTWDIVPRPKNVNIVRSMWLFKKKFDADGSLTHHKARLVANGKSQETGVDFTKTFSPVVKPATI